MRFYQEPDFKRHVLEVTVLVLLFLLAGCGFKEHQQSETTKDAAALSASRSADFSRQTTAGAQPAVEITGKDGTTIKVTPPPKAETVTLTEDEGVKANSKNQAWFSESDSFPFFVKLIGVCIGLTFLLGIIRYVRKQSAAANLAFTTADAALASQVQRLSDKAKLATSSADVAQHTTDLAALEKERRQLLEKK